MHASAFLDLNGVFAVPPIARRNDRHRTIDFDQTERIVRHIVHGGIRRFLYGGNAFLYHISLRDYEALLEWAGGLTKDLCMIPSAGPSYGRAMDQASLLKKFNFPAVMILPCADPRDATGLEQGLREFSDAAQARLIVYIKEEANWGADRDAGLDAIGRLVADGICVAIKYAVVHANPAEDRYLEGLLRRVNRNIVISGMGERPAIVHMRDFGLPAFTTGSGCIAPRLSNELFEHCQARRYNQAEAIRQCFLPLEDLRDRWNPAKVLHHAVELAGLAKTGPLIPFLSPLNADQVNRLHPVAEQLFKMSAV